MGKTWVMKSDKVHLTQSSQNVAEFSPHHCSISLLVEHTQTFHKVLIGARVFRLGNMLEHGQEGFKVNHLGVHV